jgi:hypothetical protein
MELKRQSDTKTGVVVGWIARKIEGVSSLFGVCMAFSAVLGGITGNAFLVATLPILIVMALVTELAFCAMHCLRTLK